MKAEKCIGNICPLPCAALTRAVEHLCCTHLTNLCCSHPTTQADVDLQPNSDEVAAVKHVNLQELQATIFCNQGCQAIVSTSPFMSCAVLLGLHSPHTPHHRLMWTCSPTRKR